MGTGGHGGSGVTTSATTSSATTGAATSATTSAASGALRQANPNVVVLVAELIPMNPVNTATCSTCLCTACAGRLTALNAVIGGAGGWAATHTTAASPVIVVDQFTGYDATVGADSQDGVHPNASGSTKIATKWAAALASYF